jgi:hypothetical protein
MNVGIKSSFHFIFFLGLDIPASDKAMATACLGFLTTFQPFPECKVPSLYSCITLPTFFCAIVGFFILTPLQKQWML